MSFVCGYLRQVWGGCFPEQSLGLVLQCFGWMQVTDGHTQDGLRIHSAEGRDVRRIEILLQQLEQREREECWRQSMVSCPDTKARFRKLQLEQHNIHDLQIKYPAFILLMFLLCFTLLLIPLIFILLSAPTAVGTYSVVSLLAGGCVYHYCTGWERCSLTNRSFPPSVVIAAYVKWKWALSLWLQGV